MWRWDRKRRWLVIGWAIAAGMAVGSVSDSSIPTGDRDLDPWVRVDVSATWRATKRLALGLGVDNLLDADYEEVLGFPAPGIRMRLSGRLVF